jgi:cycloeucalenol cycloisomerase
VGYLVVCLAASLPCILLPPLLEGSAEKGKPLAQRYWVKANTWIAIFSFIGNYFWTHYFYDLLGAEYTFPSWRLNGVRTCHDWGVGAADCISLSSIVKSNS